MTQLKPLQSEEVSTEIANTRGMFWGTIALDIIAMLVFGYFFAFLQRLDKTPIVYVGMVIFLSTFLAAAISTIMTIRGRQKLGAEIVLYSLSALGITMITVFQGRTPTASLSILTISVITILYLLPGQSRRWYFLVAAVSTIVMWVVEWINPSWRIQIGAATVGPVAVIVFGVILVSLATVQAWNRRNIRSRFLTVTLGLTLIATVVIAVISVSSLFSAGEHAQESSSKVLREQVQDTLKHQTIETALKNDLVLQGISQNAQDVAQQAAQVLANPGAFNPEALWKADDHMFVGPQGQYINGEGDTSTVFIPNTVKVDDNFKKRLELVAYLDMAFVPVYEDNPNTVAIYYVGSDGISWLYPNINLGSLVPPDYLATQDIFYTTGTPDNNPDRQVAWTPVYDDPGGQGLLVSAIAPIYIGNRFMGVIGIDVSLANLTKSIETEDFGSGEGSYAFLLDTEGRALALPEQGYRDVLGREREPNEFGTNLISSARDEFSPVLADALTGTVGFQSVTTEGQEFFVAYAPLDSTKWILVSVINASQVLAPATTLQTELEQSSRVLVFQRILPIGAAILALVVVVGLFFTNRLVNPIEQLTTGAAKIGTGEWDTPLPQSEMREINGLSHTLRTMAAQLKNTLGTLEQRVADRTHNLELAAEVGRAVSQVRDLNDMLRDACELILKEFDLYYVQVYLTDPSGSALKLEAGTGSVGSQLLGRRHSLPFDSGSINGRAAVEKRSVVISDTAQSPTFRPNALLPETRGEMAVPLIVADKVVGVLDMQSSQPGILNKEILPAFEALAGQLAVAVQNASLLAETEQARAQMEAQARRLVREGWSEHLDAIHKPEQLGFVFDHNKVARLAEVDEAQLPGKGKSISAPIAVTGESLGSLIVELDDEARAEQTSQLVNIVARQVAQQIENLRLLESAERYRAEAEEAARRQTIEGWQKYVESRTEENLGYLYDTNVVYPVKTGRDEDNSTFALPLMVRDELIGKLAVRGLTHEDQESVEFANVVAERLSAHIESLRLFEETRSGQIELDKRARQLAAVAEISNVSSKELDIQKMLESVVYLTQHKFGLYHAHVFIYNEDTDILKIAACGWKEGDIHEGTHGTAAIPLNQEQSLVARAARTRKAVIVNNVLLEPGWLPNPLLPDTASELAVPLVIGDQVLGVLDVQADHINAFTEEDANIQTTLASQVATALQNARSFNQAQRQAEREAMLNVINQKIQSATSVEAVLQIAARELGHALGAPMTIAQLSMKDRSS